MTGNSKPKKILLTPRIITNPTLPQEMWLGLININTQTPKKFYNFINPLTMEYNEKESKLKDDIITKFTFETYFKINNLIMTNRKNKNFIYNIKKKMYNIK